MPKIVLVAESGADIPRELAKRYHIRIVPMHVSFGNVTKADATFPSEEICLCYESTGQLPKTSCSTPEDFFRVFDAIHASNPESQILYLAYSSVTTASYQSAQLAAEGRDYVTSVDTKLASAGQCAVVIRVARLLEAHPEWDVSTLTAAAQELVERGRMCFILQDMEYLRAGGRVSNAVALCGKLLGIHPLIEFLDGRLLATKKLRGKMSNLAPRLVKTYAEENDLEQDEVWLIRSPGLADSIAQECEATAHDLGFRKINWIHTGCVITTHGGPGAFGVVGFSRKNNAE